MSTSLSADNKVWAKTRFHTKDNILHSVTTLVVNGNPEIFRFSINLQPIQQYLKARHAEMHGGTMVGWSLKGGWRSVTRGIKKTAKSIGRSKLIKKITGTTRKVIKSNVTAGILSGVAVTAAAVFPPSAAVTLPAMAAYTQARAAVEAYDAGVATAKKVKKKLVSVARMVGLTKRRKRRKVSKKVASKLRRLKSLSPAAKSRMAKKIRRLSPKVQARLRRFASRLRNAKKKRGASRLTKKQQARLALTAIANNLAKGKRITRKGVAARKSLRRNKKKYRLAILKKRRVLGIARKLRKASRSRNPKIRLAAAKQRAIMHVVAQENVRFKDIMSAGTQGVLIDPHGNISSGSYERLGAGPDLLYTPQGTTRGQYRRA